jgi:serine/threonine protein kinase
MFTTAYFSEMADMTLRQVALDAANMLHDLEVATESIPTILSQERCALLDFETCCRIPMIRPMNEGEGQDAGSDLQHDLEPMLIRNQPIGKVLYLPLENFGRYHKPIDAFACDMWALGVLLMIMLTSGFPFNPTSEESALAFYRHVRHHDIGDLLVRQPGHHSFATNHDRKPLKSIIPDDAMDAIRLLLQPDRRTRITAAQLLRHPWLSLSS